MASEPIPGLLFASAPFLRYNSPKRIGDGPLKAIICIEADKIDPSLIVHRYKLEDIEETDHILENNPVGVFKIAIAP